MCVCGESRIILDEGLRNCIGKINTSLEFFPDATNLIKGQMVGKCKQFTKLFASTWRKAEWMGRPMRLELTRVGLLV